MKFKPEYKLPKIIQTVKAESGILDVATIINTEPFWKMGRGIPIALGKRPDGSDVIFDLVQAPHLLVAGATGQGKSVTLMSIIASLLAYNDPRDLQMILIDPKLVEFKLLDRIKGKFLAKIPGTVGGVINDSQVGIDVINDLCVEMDNRYQLLYAADVNNIQEYTGEMPYIVVIIDEFADLMLSSGKNLEIPMTRLGQLARAVGIHLIIATQRPTVDVITGLIKANFPSRLAFRVASSIDSRIILDENGAEKLTGRGDAIFKFNCDNIRLQCAYASQELIRNTVQQVIEQYPGVSYELPEFFTEDDLPKILGKPKDPLFVDAAELVSQKLVGSPRMFQEKWGIDYYRSIALYEELQKFGFIGKGKRECVTELSKQMDVTTYLEYLKEK